MPIANLCLKFVPSLLLFVQYFVVVIILYIICLEWQLLQRKKKSKADWDDITIDTFVKICVNETFSGADQIVILIRLDEKNLLLSFYSIIGRDYE